MKSGPDFVGIGVQRGGTSWLFQCFKEHPEIFMPGKEIHFFDQQYDKGINWYASLFDEEDDTLVKGEMTPDYLFHKEAIVKLHSHYPNVKLILILRDPFDRAYSAVGLLRSHGRYKDMSFSEIINKDKWIIEQSLYFNQLRHLFSLFPKEQIKIYFFEDIAKRPLWLLQDVFEFIGAEQNFTPSSFKDKYNVSGTAKFANFINLEKIQNNLRQHRFGRLILKMKKLKLVRALKNSLSSSQNHEDLKSIYCSNALRAEIKRDIVKTEELLDVKLDHWY